MFQLTAILAFFILGLAFFAIGKDDFGIKKIKEDSIDSPTKDNKLKSSERELSNKPTQDIQEVNSENKSSLEANSKISD